MAGESKRAVYAAIGANSVVAAAKLAAFTVSGSAAMLSEAVHSIADVGNQSLLAIGIHKSEAGPSQAYPYGMRRDRFVWAMISAVGIFFLGCGVTVYHGVHALLHPSPIESGITVTMGVLLFALVVEGWSLLVALGAVRAQAAGRPLVAHLRQTEDPTAMAVLLEDSVAVTGVLLAMAGIGLQHLTGIQAFDAAASILIGLMMGWVAVVLVRRNRALLLGSAPDEQRLAPAVAVLEAAPSVEHVHDVKVVVLGPQAIRFKAEVDFDGRVIARTVLDRDDLTDRLAAEGSPAAMRTALEDFGEAVVTALGDEVDRLEVELTEAVPGIAHVDLETD